MPHRAASAGVAVALLSLVAIMLLAMQRDRHMDAIRTEIALVSDPARASTREIQLLLALETAGTRGYLLTGDTSFARKHLAARQRRKAEVRRLAQTTTGWGAGIEQLIERVTQQLAPADAALDSLYAGRLSRAEFVQRLPAQQARLEDVAATTRQIGEAIRARAVVRLREIEHAGERATTLTLALVALALLAAFLLVRVGFAYRSLALRETVAHAEAELRRGEAERITESRARLVHGFTHDIKNPLNSAALNLALIDEGVGDPRECAARARRGLDSALAIIEDALELARAEAGDVVVRRETVDLHELVTRVTEDVRPTSEQRGLTLQLDLPEHAVALHTDPRRVEQILENLLRNAVHYTPTGGVHVSVQEERSVDGSDAWLAIAVRDTGPGLTPAQRELLFQEFRRLETSEGTHGTGLGLAISRRIARALGGDITVESVPGAGATFTLRLPRTAATAETAVPAAAGGA